MVASVTWIVVNSLTQGGFDAGPPAVSPRVARLSQLLMVSWNLLQIPAALFLWRWLERRNPHLMLLYTACGIASLLFWGLWRCYSGDYSSARNHLPVAFRCLVAGSWFRTASRAEGPRHLYHGVREFDADGCGSNVCGARALFPDADRWLEGAALADLGRLGRRRPFSPTRR